jgi:hypothetical protein
MDRDHDQSDRRPCSTFWPLFSEREKLVSVKCSFADFLRRRFAHFGPARAGEPTFEILAVMGLHPGARAGYDDQGGNLVCLLVAVHTLHAY